MNARPYLSFGGRCEEAIRFYELALGAEVSFLTRFADGPPFLLASHAPEEILHATIMIGESPLNMSDDMAEPEGSFSGFAMLLRCDTDEDAVRCFTALSVGGEVAMDLREVPWASRYGIVRDQFQIVWKVQSGGLE